MLEPDLVSLLQALDLAAFRRETVDRFVPLGSVPAWAQPLLTPADGDAFHLSHTSFFLEHFLEEAEALWSSGADGALTSCAWSEPALHDLDDQVQATALSRDGLQFLVIAPAGKLFAEHRAILQHARQGQLEHEALIKEVEKKEVLVHCIVHDLANPLSGILGTLQLIEREPLGDMAQQMVRLALEASQRQQMLIRQILDVFSAETASMEAANLDPRHAPDLVEVARASLEHAAVSCLRRDVRAQLTIKPEGAESWRVAGERTRLERIFGNLLENALRHTPRGSEVSVTISRRGDFAEVSVEDAGSGVPEDAIPHLFKKLAPAKSGLRGKAGLGLYFCRITVERWGGEIGYRRGSGGGACFWFRLKLVA